MVAGEWGKLVSGPGEQVVYLPPLMNDPLVYLSLDLLTIAIIDCYIPREAGPLLRGLEGLSDEAAEVSVRLWAMDVQDTLSEN